MVVVRYIALAALVVWLGAMQGVLAGNRTGSFTAVAYSCGALLVVCLFALKFVGPPPRAFVARAAIVVLMLLVTLADSWWHSGATLTAINTALGFVLLAWYADE